MFLGGMGPLPIAMLVLLGGMGSLPLAMLVLLWGMELLPLVGYADDYRNGADAPSYIC